MVSMECMKQRRWIVLILVLSLTIMTLTAYLAYRELCKLFREHDILMQYGNLFLSPDEVKRLNATIHIRRVPVEPGDKSYDGFCFSNCSSRNSVFASRPPQPPGDKDNITLREILHTQPQKNLLNQKGNSSPALPDPMASTQSQSDLVHHACCNTRRRMIYPGRVRNIEGHNRLVVQFRNRKQVFFVDECTQAAGCSGCQCAQMMATYAAVVVDDNDRYGDDYQPRRRNFAGYRLELIQLPGCCKCLNNLT